MIEHEWETRADVASCTYHDAVDDLVSTAIEQGRSLSEVHADVRSAWTDIVRLFVGVSTPAPSVRDYWLRQGQQP